MASQYIPAGQQQAAFPQQQQYGAYAPPSMQHQQQHQQYVQQYQQQQQPQMQNGFYAQQGQQRIQQQQPQQQLPQYQQQQPQQYQQQPPQQQQQQQQQQRYSASYAPSSQSQSQSASQSGRSSHSNSADSPSYASSISIPPEQAQAAVEKFGSPYATNADWRPSQNLEPRLATLPSLGIGLRIKQRFARSAGDIWNPPCPCFVRDVPQSVRNYGAFQPVRCKGKGEMASDGFEPIFPGNILGPRDVSTADWNRFLQDIEVSGRLSGVQEVVAGVAPLTMHMGATGYFVTKAIKKGMARKREPVIFETIETWNQRFFIPRGLDVYVRNKTERLTATQIGGHIDPLTEAEMDRSVQHSSSNGRPAAYHRTTSMSSDDSSASDSSKEKKRRKKREKERKESQKKQDERARKEEKKEQEKIKKENKKKGSMAIVIAPAGYRPPQGMAY